MESATGSQVIEIVNISCDVGLCWSELQQVHDGITRQLDDHRSISTIAAGIIKRIEAAQRRLERARLACLELASGGLR